MGGSVDGFHTALAEEVHPIEDLQEVEGAIAYANEALAAAHSLEDFCANVNPEDGNKLSTKLLDVAVENYVERFKIPAFALESEEGSAPGPTQASKLKKVILYLYAVVERVFKALFDFFTMQKGRARSLMPLTKNYIGRADSFSASVAAQLNVRDRSLMTALHIDGIAPLKPSEMFQQMADALNEQHQYAAVPELVRLVSAARAKDSARTANEAKALHDKLQAGLQANLKTVDPDTLSVFTDKKAEGVQYYASEPRFGMNVIIGSVGEVNEKGTFHYFCGVRRDMEVPLRVGFFPVLSPDEIRAICRTALKVCETVIRNSRDEELLKKILREATFVTTKEPDESSVIALRNIAAVGQNSYIVHLRYTMRTMQSLMRWCAQSIAKYEGVGS